MRYGYYHEQWSFNGVAERNAISYYRTKYSELSYICSKRTLTSHQASDLLKTSFPFDIPQLG